LASLMNNWQGALVQYVTNSAYQEHIFWLFPPIVIVGLLLDQFTWEKYAIFLFGQAAIGMLASFWAVQVIGREREARKQRDDKPIDDAAVLAARRKQFPYYLLDPLRRTESISDHANPMRVRELRWGLLGMQTRMIRAMYASMVIFMVLGIIAYGPDGVYMWFMLAMVLCAIVAPPFLIPTFARDLQRGTLDALRSTLLRPRQVILGKFAAGLATMVPLLIGIFAASLILLGANLFFGEQVGNFFTGYGSLMVCVILVVSVCLLVSQFTRKTASAFAIAYFAILLLFGGVWFGGLYATKWTTRAITPVEVVDPGGYGQLARVRIQERYYEKVELYAQAWQFVSPLGAYGGVCDKTYYVERAPDRDVISAKVMPFNMRIRRGFLVYMWQLPSPLLMWSVSMVGFGFVSWLFVQISIWRFSKVGLRDP
ncbi:MAG: ABC transporter permease subunit, partial [Candidatus Hydrogenedentota bacterium]